MTFRGLAFSTPAWWSVTRTPFNYGVGDPCNTPGVGFFDEGVGGGEVVLSTDRLQAVFPCAAELGNPEPVRPGDGIEVNAGSRTLSEFAAEDCTWHSQNADVLHGLTACPATSPAYSALVLRLTVPGRATPVYICIGLAHNGMVARRILYSLRAA